MVAAYIVEGRSEQLIVQRLCPGSKVVLLNVNGDNVDLAAIADKIATQFALFSNRYWPVYVWFDRERRQSSVVDIISELEGHIARRGVPIDQIRIGVADRELETWILYSVDNNGKADRLCGCSQVGEFEGRSAESEIMKRLKAGGGLYHKTTIGVEMFCAISPSQLAKMSASFDRFFQLLPQECNWISS